jgi:hypothetical protein
MTGAEKRCDIDMKDNAGRMAVHLQPTLGITPAFRF